MGFIVIYNDFLNLKLHVFRAMCIWKPLPMGGIFKNNNI